MVTPVRISSARQRIVIALSIALAALPLVMFALPLASAAPPLAGQTQAPALRTITGIITDDQHEPLHGAVVELENPASHQVISYLTTADGRYIFKRVDSHTDFQLWATFRGHKSPIHSISMFDSHMDKVINIVCKTY